MIKMDEDDLKLLQGGLRKIRFMCPVVLFDELIKKEKINETFDFWVCTAIKEMLIKEEADEK